MRILDVLRSTSCINDQCTGNPGGFRVIPDILLLIRLLLSAAVTVIIIVILIVFRCIVFDDHFIDLVQHLFRQTLAKFNKQRRHKRNLVFISGQTDEILIVRVFSDLFDQFLIRIVILLLNQQRTECHARGFAGIPVLLGNSIAYSASIVSHGIIAAFFTQRLSVFICSPSGYLKSVNEICFSLLNLYMASSKVQAFFSFSGFFLALLLYHVLSLLSILRWLYLN